MFLSKHDFCSCVAAIWLGGLLNGIDVPAVATFAVMRYFHDG